MQNRVIENVGVGYYNSHDHDTTLVNVAAGNGVCLSPGFLKGGYSWVPFDCPERFDCGICLREKENREPVLRFVEILKDVYSEYSGFLRYGVPFPADPYSEEFRRIRLPVQHHSVDQDDAVLFRIIGQFLFEPR